MKLSQSWIGAGEIRVIGLLALALVPAARPAEVSGVARDAVSHAGISFVKVKLLTPEGKLYKNALSDDTGKYRIGNVAAGNYVAVFEKGDFTVDPQSVPIQLNENDVREQDATLFREQPNDAYIASLASQIKAKAHASSSIVTAYGTQWQTLENSGLSSEFKSRLAHALKEQDGEAVKVKAIQDNANEFRRTGIDLPASKVQPDDGVGTMNITTASHTVLKKPGVDSPMNTLVMTNRNKLQTEEIDLPAASSGTKSYGGDPKPVSKP